ncbi:MAG: hypothetical protein RL662_2168 [Bacteroidota bacterium]
MVYLFFLLIDTKLKRETMKKTLLSGLLSISCLLLNAQSFKVATYNIRNENTHDVGNLWKDRLPYVAQLITYHNFDFFGVQEALPKQLIDLQESLANFAYYGEGRDGNKQGEHAAIFYKTDKYILIDKGDFWLSATPTIPSKSWDAPCCNRICTWVQLKEKASGKTFFVFNAHYDYEKDYARYQSSLLVINKIAEIAKDKPVIYMGDLNGSINDAWCKVVHESGVMRNTYFDLDKPYQNSTSYNAFGKLETLDREDMKLIEEKSVIDHIFFSKHFDTKKWGLLTDTYNIGKFPSDHFPVLVDAVWAE